MRGAPAIAVLDITSTGTFINIICGTGHAADNDPSVTATAIGGGKNEIEFIAGTGSLRWSADLNPDADGTVSIAPDPMQPPTGDDCVGGFLASGSFVLPTP